MPQFERWQTRPLIRWSLLPLAILLAVCGAFPAAATTSTPLQAAGPQPSVLLGDGVVVDTAADRAFVMGAGGALESLDLGSGNVAWSRADAAKPLITADGRLIAQDRSRERGSLGVLVLGIGSGEELARATTSLPDGVRAGLVDGPGNTFELRAAHADGDVVLSWTARRAGRGRAVQGYLPAEDAGDLERPGLAPRGADRALQRSHGVLRLDLASGRIAEAGVAARSAGWNPILAELRGEQVISGLSGRQLASADGRHVLVTRRAGGADWRAYRWSVYERATGALVGTALLHQPAAPFVVSGTRLFHVAPASAAMVDGELVERTRELRAVDLSSGTELWSRSVEEVRFRGPFPP